uniref:Proprotein convertase subtilisin/kexin type 4 n=1 Tax=Zosterops lateralis melanops TaxID=1220523 RepID=A0A8D2PR88_ZOSLA
CLSPSLGSVLSPSAPFCSSCATAHVKLTVPTSRARAGLGYLSPGKASGSSLCSQVMEGEPFYHFRHRGTRQRALSRHWGWHMRLSRDPQVLWFEQQTVKRRSRRGAGVVPTDPWFPKQWYMNNDVHPDLNILTAWSRGYTGLGVVLTVLDDGLEKDHPDLAANYVTMGRIQGEQLLQGGWESTPSAHPQHCEMGVWPLQGVRMLDGSIMDIVEAQALSLQPQHIHIYSASWGPEDDGRTVDGPGVLAAAAFHRGVVQGRGGLGSIFIWASGNGGINYDNCNCDGYTNSIYTVSVGSVLGDGQRPRYSEHCPAILTTTYSSRTTSPVQIVTTDLHHRCTDKHTGTSASAPLAAGMVALALQANPALTWRDLQHLIIRASKPAHLQAEDWAENGVGRWVSHYYGYGLLDAGLLVQAATTWTGTRPQEKPQGREHPDLIRSLEHVQVQLSLSYSRRGDLVVALRSPMGTTSTLVTVRPYDTSQEGYKDWTFMSTHFWDENPKGVWTLQLENKGDDQNTGGCPMGGGEPHFYWGGHSSFSLLGGQFGFSLLATSPPFPQDPALALRVCQDTTPKLPAPHPCPGSLLSPPVPRPAEQLHPAPARHRRGHASPALRSHGHRRVSEEGPAGSLPG